MNYNTTKNQFDRMRGHEILPQQLRDQMPKLYATDGQGFEAIAYLKVFDAAGSWYWYATEFDQFDELFGLVLGDYVEWGYFSLSELETAMGYAKIPLERDLSFEPMKLREVISLHQDREGRNNRIWMPLY